MKKVGEIITNYGIILIGLLFVLLLIPPVYAYNIRIWPEEVKINSIYGTHVIQENTNLKSTILIFFSIPENYSFNHKNLTIYFEPWEHMDNEPIQDISISICDDPGSWGWNYDIGYVGSCNKSYSYSKYQYTRERSFIYQGKITFKNYSDYWITFNPERKDRLQKFIFIINYTAPHSIFDQGDYSVVWLNYPNMHDKSFPIENSLVLPTKDDIPRFIPETKKIDRIGYIEDGEFFYRWAFIFNDTDDKIVWYWNDNKIKENESRLQRNYTILGAIIGLVLAIILLFVEKLFFDWLPYGDEIERRLINKFKPDHIYGNINGKKYHKISCKYLDNIEKRNRKPFKNIEEAKKEGYAPCNLCNP